MQGELPPILLMLPASIRSQVLDQEFQKPAVGHVLDPRDTGILVKA